MSVSVIITCFNLERYVGEAIRSVLEQDYPEPAEVVVVDDCSTDGSAAVIGAAAGVRYVRTERNMGVLLATLRGLEETSGELIFFLDGDDIWEKDKLSRCIAAFERDGDCALLTHDLTYIDGDGRPLPRASRPSAVLDRLRDEARSRAIIDGLLVQDDFIWLGSAWGIRRSQARVDEFIRWANRLPDPANTYQDWPLAMWIASLPGARAAYVPAKLFRYRLHQANHSGDARSAERAVRNFTRARNTVAAMRHIAEERSLAKAIHERLSQRERAYAYQATLYGTNRRKALTLFPGAVAEFRRTGALTKEAARFAGVLLLGADRFARLAGFRR